MAKRLTIKELIKEHPEEVEEMLNEYSNYLMKRNYMDSDWYCEEPHTVLDYLEIKQK